MSLSTYDRSSVALGAVEEFVDRIIARVLAFVPSLGRWYRTASGTKKIRYALVSMVTVPIGTASVAGFDLVGLTAGWAAVLGSCVGAVPSYMLSRYWVWRMDGKNRILQQVLPFCAISFAGIVVALLGGYEAGQFTRHHEIVGTTRLVVLLGANLAAFAGFWVARYVLCNEALFVTSNSRSRADESVDISALTLGAPGT